MNPMRGLTSQSTHHTEKFLHEKEKFAPNPPTIKTAGFFPSAMANYADVDMAKRRINPTNYIILHNATALRVL